ncbi:MAG: hypothetical protein WC081_03220 [Candidatus Ratteibacteria bacterium]|jgi:hypothetical protein
MKKNKLKIRFKEINFQIILLLLAVFVFLVIFWHDRWILNKVVKPVSQTTRNIEQTPTEAPSEPLPEEGVSQAGKKEVSPAINFKSYEQERKEEEKDKGTPIS